MKLHPEMRKAIDLISRNVMDTNGFNNQPAILINENEHQYKKLVASGMLVGNIQSYVNRDTSAIPCPADREGYSPNSDFSYWCTGLSDYLKLEQIATKNGITINRYFDFGCASGRVVRMAAHQSDTIKEVWGSDINERHVRWITEYLPKKVIPIHNNTISSLPIEDNYFDVVSAFSVFTHVYSFETFWLCELRRILRPGGIAYISLHMDDSVKFWAGKDNKNEKSLGNSEEFKSAKFTEKEIFISDNSVGPYNSMVFHSENFVRKNWSRYFNILEIIPGYHGGANQAVVVLQKQK